MIIKIPLLTFLLFFVNISQSTRCNQLESIHKTVVSAQSNTLYGGHVAKHIYGNSFRQGTAFQNWNQMQEMFKLLDCQCKNMRNVCSHRKLFNGLDLVDRKEKKRSFAQAIFVVDCGFYDYRIGLSSCFLLTAYPQRAANPSWEQFEEVNQQRDLWRLFSCVILFLLILLISIIIWIVAYQFLKNKNQKKKMQHQMSDAESVIV